MSIPAPSRYRHAVIPHIMVANASRAIEFYRRAFGASELFRIARPDGRIVHAEIAIGESVIMVGDPEEPFAAPGAGGAGACVGLHVYVEEVDALAAQASAVGADVLQQPQDMFYGDRMAMLADPYGHIWVLLTPLEELAPQEIKTRGEAALAGV